MVDDDPIVVSDGKEVSGRIHPFHSGAKGWRFSQAAHGYDDDCVAESLTPQQIAEVATVMIERWSRVRELANWRGGSNGL